MADKKVLQQRVEPETIELLKKLACKEKRAIGATLDVIILEAAIKAKLVK